MRCATVEVETREEVMREMEERMRSMERMFARRLTNEVCFIFPLQCMFVDCSVSGGTERDED
jgi:hypothetical protein